MTTDTKALRERLREWAQNEEMVDQYLTAHGHDCIEAADAIERLEAERDRYRAALAFAETSYVAAPNAMLPATTTPPAPR